MSQETNPKPMTKADVDSHRALTRLDEQFDIACRMAPAFRDKFDFSEDANHGALAELAFKAADALLKKRADLTREITKKHEEDTRKEQEAKK